MRCARPLAFSPALFSLFSSLTVLDLHAEGRERNHDAVPHSHDHPLSATPSSSAFVSAAFVSAGQVCLSWKSRSWRTYSGFIVPCLLLALRLTYYSVQILLIITVAPRRIMGNPPRPPLASNGEDSRSVMQVFNATTWAQNADVTCIEGATIPFKAVVSARRTRVEQPRFGLLRDMRAIDSRGRLRREARPTGTIQPPPSTSVSLPPLPCPVHRSTRKCLFTSNAHVLESLRLMVFHLQLGVTAEGHRSTFLLLWTQVYRQHADLHLQALLVRRRSVCTQAFIMICPASARARTQRREQGDELKNCVAAVRNSMYRPPSVECSLLHLHIDCGILYSLGDSEIPASTL
ncbi:hypothetical protein K438DRAFT_1938492 [Mycena galopus ATCC 62051]|nr:hypothetical protein K438DRAFT_1938492 [Mycena galopus ATCC 62051]